MVVETMKKEHLSIYAAMQEFGINDHKIIERWERIYLDEEALWAGCWNGDCGQ